VAGIYLRYPAVGEGAEVDEFADLLHPGVTMDATLPHVRVNVSAEKQTLGVPSPFSWSDG